MTSQIAEMTSSSIFFDIVLFLLLSLVTGPEIPEILLSEFCPISGDWGKFYLFSYLFILYLKLTDS